MHATANEKETGSGKVAADNNSMKNTETKSGNNHVLQGAQIFLRPMTRDDTERIITWRNKDFVRNNFIYRKPFTAEGHLHWIETMVDTGKAVQFMICEKQGRAVGSVYLRDIDPVHHKAEYGIFIGEEDALSKGYGTEAAKMMTAYAFEELGLHKLNLRLLAGNERAKKSYEKAGFVQEGYFRDEVLLDGKYCDVIFMGMIRS